MDPNDTDRKDNDVSDTGIVPERKEDGIHVHGNVACSISAAGQLEVSAITAPITAHSVTDMKVTAGNVLVSQAKSDNMKIRATNIGGKLIFSYSTYC
jgi:hypothetical protein